MSVKVIHTSNAIATGGRNGHTRSGDGVIDVNLSIPQAMGGPGKEGATTPEDLFAAGYAACFGSAVEFLGHQMKLRPKKVEIEAAVGIGTTDAGTFGLKVDLLATLDGLTQEDAEKLVHAAHQVCPYSNAIRGNVEVGITVRGSESATPQAIEG